MYRWEAQWPCRAHVRDSHSQALYGNSFSQTTLLPSGRTALSQQPHPVPLRTVARESRSPARSPGPIVRIRMDLPPIFAIGSVVFATTL